MTILVANDAVGALASSINDTVLTLALGSGQGALFPNPGADEFFYITAIRASDGGKEIMKCTARSTDTLTVVRAQDGTTAKTFAASDRVELRPIRAIHQNYAQLDTANTFVGNQTITGSLSVSNDITITDDLIVGDDASIAGDLTVTGTILMSSRKVDALNAGVTMLFRQTSVPTGWTKITTWNDAALRIVSGTPSQKADAGDEFTTLLAARTIATDNLPSHSHTFSGTTSTDGAHTHTYTQPPGEFGVSTGGTSAPRGNNTTQNTGSSGSHSHTYSGTTSSVGSGTAMAFDVNYVDVYLASKDA